jgi:D-glycero-D-manno-heptose 1,7-bisphosphate phosphatase
MLLQAEQDFQIDMPRSILIGDKSSDIEAGRSAGVGTLLQLGGVAEIENCTVISRLSDALVQLSVGYI